MNTHRIFKELEEKGITPETIVEAFEAFEDERLATKEDLRDLRGELKEDIHQLRMELKEDNHRLRTELKEDIHQLQTELKEDIHQLQTKVKEDISGLREEMQKIRVEIKESKSETIKWMVNTIIGQTALFLGFIYLIIKGVI